MILDLRYALRGLRRNPGFTAVAVLVLALGLGANTAIFSVFHAVWLRPLPYPESGRLVVVWDQLTKLNLERFPAPFAHYYDYRDQNRVFEDLAAFSPAEFNLTGAGASPERVAGLRVTANLFPLLGVAAVLPEGDNVVLLSHALWQRRFGADPQIAGRSIQLDGSPYTVAGILPAELRTAPLDADLFVPLVLRPDPTRNAGAVQMLARLKPGVSLPQALAGMKAIAANLEQQYHPYRGPQGQDAGYNVTVAGLRDELYGRLRRPLDVLLGAVGLLLLVACANVANLLLARAAARHQEIAIRQALGASRLQLVRQLLVESALLSLCGAAAGLLLARWSLDALLALTPESLPPVHLNPAVLGFSLLLALLTTIVFSLAPALRLRPLAPSLVTAEVALSLTLLIAAGLLTKSLLALQHVNPGFRPDQLLTLRITLPRQQYPENHQAASFYRQLLERLESTPGVTAAGVSTRLPLTGGPGADPFSIEGRPYSSSGPVRQVVHSQVVSPGYFRAMGIRLAAGRLFTARDAPGAEPVVIINETMARGFWPDPPAVLKDPPLGKRILLGAPRPGAVWLTIVGIAGDVRVAGLDRTPLPQMYLPLPQSPARSVALVLRASGDSATLASLARAAVASLDPEQPVYDVWTMEQRLAATLAPPRFQTLLLGSFAALALVLAAAGIYGVVSYSVARRTREIGIRMALGAEPAGVRALVLRQGMIPVLIGLALGLVAAFALSRVLSTLLYQVSPTDPLIFATAPLALFLAALAACYLPARRATRIDPMSALRE